MNLLKTALVTIALHSCILLGADFFPLQEGNTWTYRESATGRMFSVRVGAPVTIGGSEHFKLTGYTNTDLLVRVDGVYGSLVYWDDGLGQDLLLTSFESFEGGYWLARFRPCPEQVGQTLFQRVTHDGPAGPVDGALQIRYLAIGCADAGPVAEQYAEHLGMLRRVDDTIAGPRTYDLISARVGNLKIDAAQTGQFSVTVVPTVAAGTASATLHLRIHPASPLTLTFPSGQEYDFALLDSLGNTLWTWSADRTFVQMVHQRTVNDEWIATVQIPWPTAPDGGLLPGGYTVRALVTATSATPFAATAPVTIPPR